MHAPGQCSGWTGDTFVSGECRLCWKVRNPATLGTAPPARSNSRTAVIPSPGRISLPITLHSAAPCVHLGPAQVNQGCGCKEKLRACEIHGTCTTGTQRAGVKCCESCGDFRSFDDGDVDHRHLLYYCCPVTQNRAVWQAGLDQLKRRLSLFNGRRVIAIATGSIPGRYSKLDPPEDVVKYFGAGVDFIFVPHQKKLGEVTAFVDLWKRVSMFRGPNDFTFYGHSKGVTKPVDPGTSVHRWGDLMYRANLDHWDTVRETLRQYPITGAFKKVGPCFGGKALWHYHGTFYWCRNADVFAGNWMALWKHYGGTELWPAQMWRDPASSGCHFYGGIGFNMYSVEEVARAEACIISWPWVTRDG